MYKISGLRYKNQVEKIQFLPFAISAYSYICVQDLHIVFFSINNHYRIFCVSKCIIQYNFNKETICGSASYRTLQK